MQQLTSSQSLAAGARLLQEVEARGDSCQCGGPLTLGEAERRRELAMARSHTLSKKASPYRSNHLYKA